MSSSTTKVNSSDFEKIKKENASCTLIVPELPSAPFYPALQSDPVKSHMVDTFVLPRINVIKKRLGNNCKFVKEPLSFNMLALKFVFASCEYYVLLQVLV